ncbi:MAG: acyl-CoA thioesterase [Xanthomonadales bacterium]|jgi:acyl-CoA thioester hydrolase|nr:acyl-CoA thioesterase [Xanthomonadales bacterium]
MSQRSDTGNDPGGESLPMILFRMPLDLRWRDLDAFNHVNNANFMTYVEEARIRWFESTGGDWLSNGRIPLLASVQMNYRLPIPYPARVFVELLTERVGNTSLTLGHRIIGEDDRLYADGHSVLVWIEMASGRPVPLPDAVRAAADMG